MATLTRWSRIRELIPSLRILASRGLLSTSPGGHLAGVTLPSSSISADDARRQQDAGGFSGRHCFSGRRLLSSKAGGNGEDDDEEGGTIEDGAADEDDDFLDLDDLEGDELDEIAHQGLSGRTASEGGGAEGEEEGMEEGTAAMMQQEAKNLDAHLRYRYKPFLELVQQQDSSFLDVKQVVRDRMDLQALLFDYHLGHGQRSGRKLLRKSMVGHRLVDWYLPDITRGDPQMVDYAREEREDQLDQLRRRGKGPPKKGKGKRSR